MKTINLYILLSFLFLFSLTKAQDKKLEDAFADSYTFESEEKYEDALKEIEAFKNDKSYEINLRLGWLYYLNANFEKGIEHYKIADELMPASTQAKWGIVTLYSATENWNRLEETYNKIISLDPKDETAHYYLGLIHYNRKDYVTAKNHFEIALNLQPFTYNYMLMSAWTNYFLGNMNNASVLFKKVLLISPKDASALEGLSLIK
jgi:tetratricopeptide (TPR) repeat protein